MSIKSNAYIQLRKIKTGIPSLPKFKSRDYSGGCPAFLAGYQNMYKSCTLRLVIDYKKTRTPVYKLSVEFKVV